MGGSEVQSGGVNLESVASSHPQLGETSLCTPINFFGKFLYSRIDFKGAFWRFLRPPLNIKNAPHFVQHITFTSFFSTADPCRLLAAEIKLYELSVQEVVLVENTRTALHLQAPPPYHQYTCTQYVNYSKN